MDKKRRKELKEEAANLYPYPTNGNERDPEDFKFRCKKVDEKRKLYIIRKS